MADAHPAANPLVLAFITADSIFRDGHGKHNIMGIFNTIGARAYPVMHPYMALYLAMTEGYGQITMIIHLVGVENEEHLYQGELKVQFQSPLEVREFNLPAPKIIFPAPGEYRWQVLCGDELLCERRLIASVDLLP